MKNYIILFNRLIVKLNINSKHSPLIKLFRKEYFSENRLSHVYFQKTKLHETLKQHVFLINRKSTVDVTALFLNTYSI